MDKEQLIIFIKDNYCDIEKYPLPKIVSTLPEKERLLNRRQKDSLIDKARQLHDDKFADFLERAMAKGCVP